VRAGDRLLRINETPVQDVIDYLYGLGDDEVNLQIERPGTGERLNVVCESGQDCGIELEAPKPKVCRNKCVFCFVAQLPKGLRRTLYVRDEDYRLSFLYGNYITLTNLTEADRERILRQRLSPLYISVHSVDPEVRRRLLGREDLPDIAPQIERFINGGIRIHAQVVLCPGINDGRDLDRTIRTLAGFHPGVLSLAVVPVGLTAYHRKGLVPLDGALAARTVRQVERWQARMRTRHAYGFVYCSDEMFLLAGLPIPPAGYYDEFPQIENGVGLVREFLDGLDALSLPKRVRRKVSILLFTGESFHPFLKRAAARLERRVAGVRISVVKIRNELLGGRVTVAGLLAGRDVVRALSGRKADAVLIPSVVLRDGNGLFLDDVSVPALETATGLRAVIVEPTPEGLLQGIREASRAEARPPAAASSRTGRGRG